jgi:hypothetical protein
MKGTHQRVQSARACQKFRSCLLVPTSAPGGMNNEDLILNSHSRPSFHHDPNLAFPELMNQFKLVIMWLPLGEGYQFVSGPACSSSLNHNRPCYLLEASGCSFNLPLSSPPPTPPPVQYIIMG